MKRIGLLLLIISIYTSMPLSCLFPVPADVRDISDRDYLEPTLEAIRNAQESIYMVMYLISFMPEEKGTPVAKLLYSLKEAHERGVYVRAIIDYRSSKSLQDGQIGYNAYKFLKDNGIDVRFDIANIYTHNKTIVIDKKIVIAGSANWSEAAISKSNETNFIMESPQIAQSLVSRFDKIELAPVKEETANTVLVPIILMDKDSVFQDMLRRHDKRSFNISLLLFNRWHSQKNGKIEITYKEIAKGIGMNREDYRDMLNRTLKKLQNRYKLIKLSIGWNKPVEIILLDPETKSVLEKLDGEKCFNIPKEYWQYGWNKRLTFAEKYSLLINILEMSNQTKWNEWLMTREQLVGKYGITSTTISKGMAGLRRYHIIDIEYGEIKEGYDNRKPAKTTFLGLYDWNEFEKELNKLHQKHGKAKIKRARKYAAIVFRDHDISSIEDILEFIDIYGEDIVKKAFHKVAQKNIDNPKRTFKYVVGILKNR